MARALLRRGEPLCVSFPTIGQFPKTKTSPHQDRRSPHRIRTRSPPRIARTSATVRPGMSARKPGTSGSARRASRSARRAQPMPESAEQSPPLIRRQEVVAIALVGLLADCRHGRALLRKGLLPAGRHGLRGRHHAVAGRLLPRTLSRAPRRRRGPDRGRGRRIRHLHRRIDRGTRHGMGLAAAGARRAAEGQAAYLRPAAGAVARAVDHARRLRRAHYAADAEIRMGAADAGIPVADLHRIPAVLRDPAAVHRELEGSAPRHDHGLSATGLRGCARCASSTRSRSISAAIC